MTKKKKEETSVKTEDGQHNDALARLTAGNKDGSFHLGTKLRNYFLTGIIIVGPLCITLYVVWWFINFVDAWVKPFVPDIYNPDTYLPFPVPGIGLIFAICVLMFIGALTANLFGRTLVSYGEILLGRMPVVRNLYSALKQIFETVLSQSGNSFKEVGLIEYPRKGLYAICFISKETGGEVRHRSGETDALLSVFLPTTPNPTSGFLLFVPRREIEILDMTVEEAAKLVISGGLVEPEHVRKKAAVQEIAESAREGSAKIA